VGGSGVFSTHDAHLLLAQLRRWQPTVSCSNRLPRALTLLA